MPATSTRWPTPGDYTYYRLAISAPQSGTLLQLADWDLAVDATGVPDQPMITSTGNGPGSGLNIKQNAGFTGLHAYRYAGKQTATGDVYETNVIAKDLDVPVGPNSQLSYKILPQSMSNYTTYPSTYAADRPALHRRHLPVAAASGRPARRPR